MKRVSNKAKFIGPVRKYRDVHWYAQPDATMGQVRFWGDGQIQVLDLDSGRLYQVAKVEVRQKHKTVSLHFNHDWVKSCPFFEELPIESGEVVAVNLDSTESLLGDL